MQASDNWGRMWKVHGGPEEQFVHEALGGGWAILLFGAMGDLTGVETRDELRTRVQAAYPKSSVGLFTRELFDFLDMKRGDIVLMPSNRHKTVSIGVVEGPYKYHTEVAVGRHRRRIHWVRSELPLDAYPGLGRALRAIQIWTVKEVSDARGRTEAVELLSTGTFEPGEEKIIGQGIGLGPKQRKAVERHAMDLAKEYFRRQWATVEDKSRGNPYDLLCRAPGKTDLHVEVKGTTTGGGFIMLTAGEVKHARDYSSIALYILSNIEVESEQVESPSARGGSRTVFEPWSVDNHGNMEPTQFRYRLQNQS